MGGMDFFFLEAHALIQNSPAHAGNTLDKNATVTIAQDHPRLRGEYTVGALLIPSSLGSPPLARGILKFIESEMNVRRITPACAGNTYQRSPERSVLRDHPRLRGEYEQKSQGERLAKGSPPLARGIPSARIVTRSVLRITSACAGNTSISVHSHTHQGDHPRLRGEYFD